MARSIAAAMAGSMVTSRGAMAMASGAIATPSNRAICSATKASPRARTPAIIKSATCSAFIDGFLDPRDQLANPLRLRSIDVAADDQPRRDLRDQILQLELVHARRLAGLDQVDDVRRQIE